MVVQQLGEKAAKKQTSVRNFWRLVVATEQCVFIKTSEQFLAVFCNEKNPSIYNKTSGQFPPVLAVRQSCFLWKIFRVFLTTATLWQQNCAF